ncbi:MAG: hypothetical protein ACLSC9_00600 [Barnesiella sp.]
MKKLIVLIIALSCCIVSWAGCPEQIKAFYSEYMHNLMHGNDSQNKGLCEKYITRALIQKIQRISYATGADAIIRAQDVNEAAIQSLYVEDLGDNWYLVHYLWDIDDKGSDTEIPLKVQKAGDTCQIVYITPVWSGSLYGDKLLSNKEIVPREISQKSGQAFLESFYKTYLNPYIRISENLQPDLEILRTKYLTRNAAQEFNLAEQNQLADGVKGYDLLIDNFDFDYLWHKSLHISSLGDNYIVEYKSGDKVHKIVISLKKCNGNYFIDGISTGC